MISAFYTGCFNQQHIPTESQAYPETPSGGELQETLDICEAVFWYQFNHNASAVQQNAKAYFIKILNQDPSDEFLARFRKNMPPVRKGSVFAIGEGLLFYISSINRIDDNTAHVSGGYYEAGTSSSGNIYTVVRKNRKWVVDYDEMQWVS